MTTSADACRWALFDCGEYAQTEVQWIAHDDSERAIAGWATLLDGRYEATMPTIFGTEERILGSYKTLRAAIEDIQWVFLNFSNAQDTLRDEL